MRRFPRGVYEIWLCNSYGARAAPLWPVRSLTYSVGDPVQQVGQLTVKVSAKWWQQANIASLVEVWRSPMPGVWPRHEGTFILETVEQDRDGLTLGGSHTTKLLDFRIVDADKDSAGANKTGAADDLIKQFGREQLAALAGSGRDFNAWFPFAVEPDYGLGPTVSKEASRAGLLDTAQGLVKAASEHDNYPAWVSFEVANTGHDLQFGVVLRTHYDYRGVDRGLTSISPLVLSDGNALGGVKRLQDHTREKTVALVGGAGSGANRTKVTVTDAVRAGAAPWWRREVWLDGGSEETATAVLKEKGERKLRDGRPIDRFTAALLPHPVIMYGVNLAWGDKVGVEAFGRIWNSRITGVSVSASERDEKIDLKLEAVST